MAGIIKVNGRHRLTSAAGATSFNVEDMQARGEQYLAEIKRQAAEILTTAKHEADQIRAQAVVDGQAEALGQAKASLQPEVDQRVQQLLALVVEVVAEVRQEKDAWLRQWEQNAVHLAAAIAQKVIRREVSGSMEITQDLIRESLELAAGSKQISLHVSPADYDLLSDNVSLLSHELANIAPAQIVRDEQVTRGGCRIETEHGSIDQQIETQLARIEEELTS